MILRYLLSGSLLLLIWLTYGLLTIFPFAIEPSLLVGLGSFAGFQCVFFTFLRRKRTTKEGIIAVAIFGIFLGGVNWIRNMPVSRFKSAYAAIKIGMTEAEVNAVIRREFPRASPPIHINQPGGYIGPPPDGPNAEFIGVSLTEGRVSSKEYIPD